LPSQITSTQATKWARTTERLAKIFEDIASGKKKRVIVNIAPRHGKSELISYLAPAWFLGKYPHKKVIMASHTADLAVNFGRRVRNLVNLDGLPGHFPADWSFSRTQNRPHGGVQTSTASILRLVWAVRLPVVVLIYLLLTTHTLNKRQNRVGLTFFSPRGNGFNQARCSG
jgi:hypothetical protein